jgi:hypothetical protein
MTEPSETRAGISRRTVLRGAAVAGAAAAGGVLSGGSASAAPGPGGHGTEGSFRADLILHNGRIHTMDDRNRVVSVVAISEGRIVYAGTNVTTAKHGFEDKPRMIDLRGRTAIPGIIDCHNHVVLMGNRPGHHTPLENAYSIADVQATYRARARGSTTADSSPRSAASTPTSSASTGCRPWPSWTRPCRTRRPTSRSGSPGRR